MQSERQRPLELGARVSKTLRAAAEFPSDRSFSASGAQSLSFSLSFYVELTRWRRNRREPEPHVLLTALAICRLIG